jgi:hypothetical protein
MEHPRFLTADFSTDFISEEWDGRGLNATVLVGQEHGPQEQETENDVSPEQIAAIMGSLLLEERIERERLRYQAASNGEGERSRWRDACRRETLRRLMIP